MNRYALCIGNANYIVSSLGHLPAAIEDAKAIGEELTSLGFNVDTRFDLESRDMAVAIGGLEDKIKQYDSVLFYYAGHGFEIDGVNILAPVNLNPDDSKSAILYDAYKLSELMDLLDRADDNKVPKTKIIILDACRTQLNVRGGSQFFAPILAPQGSIIAFSTSPGQTAKESGIHGIYTNALLRYMDAPRISVERVFKRVRTALVNETNGAQIPWEHTSLIGDYYLNPNTIYDGTGYSHEAIADSEYIFTRNSKIRDIVSGFKSHNFYQQQDALKDFKRIPRSEIDDITADELFVLGRNIYQAACGGCWDCQRFIDDFGTCSFISDAAKLHILNGMAFEIYYDSRGEIRKNLKGEYSPKVIEILEKEEYYGSLMFITSRLEKEESIFYIPGQDEKVDVSVSTREADENVISDVKEKKSRLSNVLIVEDIFCRGRSIYYKTYGTEKATVVDWDYRVVNKTQFEEELCEKMSVANGYLSVNYNGSIVDDKSALLIPFIGFNVHPSEDYFL